MLDEQDTALYPAWREGYKRFVSEGFTPGDEIPKEWFYNAFGIEMPAPTCPVKEADKARLEFMAAFLAMRESLLTERQVALANMRGYGYRVVTPQEQTRWAEEEGIDEVKHAVTKMGTRLVNVDLAALDGTQRKENADALARLSMMRGMIRSVTDRKHIGNVAD